MIHEVHEVTKVPSSKRANDEGFALAVTVTQSLHLESKTSEVSVLGVKITLLESLVGSLGDKCREESPLFTENSV